MPGIQRAEEKSAVAVNLSTIASYGQAAAEGCLQRLSIAALALAGETTGLRVLLPVEELMRDENFFGNRICVVGGIASLAENALDPRRVEPPLRVKPVGRETSL